MDTKSRDGERKVGSPRESEVTMEICSGGSVLGKRNLETRDAKNIGESNAEEEEKGDDIEDEEGEGEAEENGDDSGWDKDSFKGREYHSSDSENEGLDELSRSHRRLVIESKGFFGSNPGAPYCVVSGIGAIPYIDRDTCPEVFNCRKFLSSIASDCLAKYNTRNKKNLIFEKVLSANFNPISTTARYYITFTAKESPDGPEVEYQAKADWCADVTYPILCRPSPVQKAQGDGKDDFNCPN